MKNKTRRLAAFLLSAAVVITAVPGMQERVYAQKTGGYTESPKSENVPVGSVCKLCPEGFYFIHPDIFCRINC